MSTVHRRRWGSIPFAVIFALPLAAAWPSPAAAEEPKAWFSASCDQQVCLLVLDEKSDTDGDGVADVDEERLGTDPQDPKSTPPAALVIDEFLSRGLPSFEGHLSELVILPVLTSEGDALRTLLGDISLHEENSGFIDTTSDLITGLTAGRGSLLGIAGTRMDTDPGNAVSVFLATTFGPQAVARDVGEVSWGVDGGTTSVEVGSTSLVATYSTWAEDGGDTFEQIAFSLFAPDAEQLSGTWNQCLECDGEDTGDGGDGGPAGPGGDTGDGGNTGGDTGGDNGDGGDGGDSGDGGDTGGDNGDGGDTGGDNGGDGGDTGGDNGDGGDTGGDNGDGGGTGPDDTYDDHWDGDEWHNHLHDLGGAGSDWDKEYGNPEYVEIRITAEVVEEALVWIDALRDPTGDPHTGDGEPAVGQPIDKRGWYIHTTDEGVTTLSAGTPPIHMGLDGDFHPDDYSGLYEMGKTLQPSLDDNPYIHED